MDEPDSCPECDALGVLTALSKVQSLQTDIVVAKTMDKDGKWHTHDEQNEFCDVYLCALDHEQRVQYTGKPCWCSWLPPEERRRRRGILKRGVDIITSDSFVD